MASFQEHIDQAYKNIDFLCCVNCYCRSNIDWQTTVSFYVCVHLINAHVAQTSNQHYRTHVQIDKSINPFVVPPKASALPQGIYTTYGKLKNLSRRSRYLVNNDPSNTSVQAFHTKEKHFGKSIEYLDNIMDFMATTHTVTFTVKNINCHLIKNKNLNYFQHKEPASCV